MLKRFNSFEEYENASKKVKVLFEDSLKDREPTPLVVSKASDAILDLYAKMESLQDIHKQLSEALLAAYNKIDRLEKDKIKLQKQMQNEIIRNSGDFVRVKLGVSTNGKAFERLRSWTFDKIHSIKNRLSRLELEECEENFESEEEGESDHGPMEDYENVSEHEEIILS